MAQVQPVGPASTGGPASTVTCFTQRDCSQRSDEVQLTHNAPPRPQVVRAEPVVHSPRSVQQPSQFEALHGFWQPLTTMRMKNTTQRMCATV